MLFERAGDVIVLVHGAQNPSDAEWDVYCDFVRSTQHGGGKPVSSLLVTTLGGSPNAMQRKGILAAAGHKVTPTSVCTDSTVARGVITAISWLSSAPMYALPLRAIEAALNKLGVPEQQHAEIKAVLERLQSQLPS